MEFFVFFPSALCRSHLGRRPTHRSAARPSLRLLPPSNTGPGVSTRYIAFSFSAQGILFSVQYLFFSWVSVFSPPNGCFPLAAPSPPGLQRLFFSPGFLPQLFPTIPPPHFSFWLFNKMSLFFTMVARTPPPMRPLTARSPRTPSLGPVSVY